MGFLRMHWFDIGIGLAVIVGAFVFFVHPTGIAFVLWVSLITLFLHQFEEYRYPGYFPGMMNVAMFASDKPDRYPLNPQIALVVNLTVGWLFYFLAALFNLQAIWLGIATILVSLGNFFAHTFLFNLKGKTKYNPGMFTAIVLFLPLSIYFFASVIQNSLASPLDWIIGIILGIALNVVGILKMIDWFKEENTPFVFPARCLLPPSTNRT